MTRWILSLVLLLLPGLAHATTYYVDPTGNDTTGTGAIGAPWLTPQKCVDTVVAGDTCSINDGTYTSSSATLISISTNADSGNSSSPITLKSTNPLGAILHTKTSLNQAQRAILINSKSWWIIEGFEIRDDTGTTTGASASIHGIYHAGSSSSNNVIRKNYIHNMARGICSTSVNGFTGIFVDNGSNLLIERNLIHTIGRLRVGEGGCGSSVTNDSNDHGIYLKNVSTVTIRRNLIYDANRGYVIQSFGGTVSTLTIDNNTFAGQSPTSLPAGQIRLASTINTCNIRNNLFYDAKTSALNISSLTMTSCSATHNRMSTNDTAGDNITTGTPTSGTMTTSNNTDNSALGFVDVACTQGDGGCESTDFNLASTSAAIDAGTAVCAAYNGAGCDQGVYETFAFASCVVEDGDASKVRVTFTNNAFPPLLPAASPGTFTTRKATVANVVTASTVTGDNRVDLTVTNAIVAGNAVDISWASGNLTDSALIGGTLNQGYKTVLTNQSCTNNVGAAAAHVFTQAAFEFHGLRGTEAAPVGTPYATAPENTNIQVRVGGSVRLRIALTCTIADCPPTGFYPRYSKNAGAYTVIPDTFAADNIAFCGTSPDPDIPTNGTATTDQLSTAGAFVSGALVRTSNAIPTIDLDDSPAQKTELEYCISFDTDATAGDTYDIRLYEQDGTALGVYTVTPRITLAAERAGMGF